MQSVFIYHAQITPDDGRDPIELDVGYRGVDQARIALAERFRVPPAAIKIKSERDVHGQPREILIETGRDETGEQCWSDNLNGARCTNRARPGFHTCKIHTIFSAPFPFGTPEYRKWERETDIDGNPRTSKRRPRATGAKTGTTTPKTAGKPANRRSRGRKEQ